MRYSSLLPPALALALASSTYADMQPLTQDTSDVISLTADDFETIVNPEPLILVEFFAPWCGHCKALAPEYEEAATALKAKNIKISKVDCVDQTDLCQSKGISGYPTLHVYKNGTPTDYTGPRKADGIVAYMIKQSLPAVSLVSNSNFEEFSNADKVVVVAYAAKEDPLTALFATAAEAHRDEYLFGQVEDQTFAAEQDITTPTIVVYRSFDDRAVSYPYPISAATPEEIAAWIQELSVPILDEVSGENYATYASSTKPLAYLFLDPTVEGKDEKIAAFKPIAAKYKSKLNFVWIDAIKFGDHGKALNLNEPKWPSFVIQDLVSQLKYPMDQTKDHTEEATEEWIRQYLDGKLVPSLKSQPIPESQDEPVFTVVGKQFDEVVLDESKDVFIEFYATWCGHCKRLKPIWDSLGEHFANVKDRVVIAKMEATENDLPPSVDFRISGFPTLKFKPAGSKEWLDYDGDRTLESLVAFVEEKAKNSLEVKATEPEVVAEAGEAQEPVNTTSGHDEL